MRKRNIVKAVDTIFWWGLYALPIIAYLVFLYSSLQNPAFSEGSAEFIHFGSFMTIFCDMFGGDLHLALVEIFADDGILPIFNDATFIPYIVWFIGVNLVHLFVDFILFIPRLAHKWMGAFTRSED